MNRRLHHLWCWHFDSSPWWFAAYTEPWAWRPYCWIRGWHEPHHMDMHHEHCLWCTKRLWSRRRNGLPNTVQRIELVPTSWRKLRRQPLVPLRKWR